MDNYYTLNKDIDIETLDWWLLSNHSKAILFLEDHLDKIFWGRLSGNIYACELLKKHLDKVNWKILSRNRGAKSILEAPENAHKVVLKELLKNSAIKKYSNNSQWNILSINLSPRILHFYDKLHPPLDNYDSDDEDENIE